MPLLPASLIEPLWVEFATLIGSGERAEFSATHPWGCHRRRVPDRVVFDHVIAALVHGSGYERIAHPGCSRTAAPRGVGHGRTAQTCYGFAGRVRPMIGPTSTSRVVDRSPHPPVVVSIRT